MQCVSAAAGFRRLGFGRIISTLAVPFIHGSFSYPTAPTILPDPFMRWKPSTSSVLGEFWGL
jgi:hypothetical protein